MIVIVGVSLCRNEMEHFFIFQAFSWLFFFNLKCLYPFFSVGSFLSF